jgi:hypothetical protein
MTNDEIMGIALEKLGDWNGSIYPFASAIIARTLEEAAQIADGYPGAHSDDIARDIRALIDRKDKAT